MIGSGHQTQQPAIVDERVAGPHGPVPVRSYPAADGAAGAPAPGLVWLHGGGFVHGDLDMPEADWVARQFAARGIGVVSVDYRLVGGADGVHFPVPSDDVLAAYAWTLENADRLGLDPANIALGGASAGGALAAAAALRLRDAAGPTPSRVLLAYPTVHAALPEPSAELAEKIARLAAEGLFNPARVGEMNLAYVGDAGELANPYAFPGGHDLAGLPPTLIINSDLDSLRSSGEAYAAELRAAGVDIHCLREDGTRHGHLNKPDLPGAQKSLERMAAWLLAASDDTTSSSSPSSIKEAS